MILHEIGIGDSKFSMFKSYYRTKIEENAKYKKMLKEKLDVFFMFRQNIFVYNICKSHDVRVNDLSFNCLMSNQYDL